VKYLIFLSGVWRFGILNAVVLFPDFWDSFLGASGAIAGVMGAYILRFPRAEILTLIPLGCTFLQCASRVLLSRFWFLQQAFWYQPVLPTLGWRVVGLPTGHTGGFIFGAILGPCWVVWPESQKEKYLYKT